MKRMSTVLAVGLSALGGVLAHGATIGFTEDFASLPASWSGGSTLSNPSGGVDGALDGFLRVSESPFPRSLGAYTSGAEFTGNLSADGVTGFSFYLSNIDDNENVEIHVAVGQAFGNVWLYIEGFVPPSTGWEQFQVDLTDETKWVQIIGAGSFADALTVSDRLLFRHDFAPLMQAPDPIAGDFGVDKVTVLGTVVCTGDVDGDGDVDLDDLLLVLGNFGCPGGCVAGDVDADGDVDLDDLLLVLGAFGLVC